MVYFLWYLKSLWYIEVNADLWEFLVLQISRLDYKLFSAKARAFGWTGRFCSLAAIPSATSKLIHAKFPPPLLHRSRQQLSPHPRPRQHQRRAHQRRSHRRGPHRTRRRSNHRRQPLSRQLGFDGQGRFPLAPQERPRPPSPKDEDDERLESSDEPIPLNESGRPRRSQGPPAKRRRVVYPARKTRIGAGKRRIASSVN